MKSLVVYGTRYGNTEKIALAVSTGLRSIGVVEMLTVEKAQDVRVREYDLVVFGGPTEGHGVTEPVAAYVDRIGDAITGIAVATFDTRLRWPKWVSGSAADAIAGRLEKFGADLIIAPASFIVTGKPTALEPGELERAEAWGRALGIKVSSVLAPKAV
ncbi:MAG TPA: flavodoxin domain-containing protein [Candidatus Dormibacteraeota bacterium]|nr:flavodoxin domain-containing protein [Candidatus Dormibacteraeota bacterium]